MRRALVGLVSLAVVAALAWVGWATATQRAVEGWLRDREADGWSVVVADLSVRGFPSAFETTLTEPALADPANGWAWTAPDFRLSQPAWDLSQVTAHWPQEQQLAGPGERVRITNSGMTSHLDVRPTQNFALDAARTTLSDLIMESSLGGRLSMAHGDLDMTRLAGTEAQYDIRLEAQEVQLPGALVASLDPDGLLPAVIPVFIYAAEVAFSRPWDLSALETARPQPREVTLHELRAEWGPLLLRGAGDLEIDPEGRATGALSVRAENWEEMLAIAVRSGALAQSLEGTARTALRFVAGLRGQPEHLDATIRFSEGYMFLGPLPIGEAPRFLLR